jgi:hypothetical protein
MMYHPFGVKRTACSGTLKGCHVIAGGEAPRKRKTKVAVHGVFLLTDPPAARGAV